MRLFLFILLFTFRTIAFSQASTDSTANCIAYWQNGEQKKLKISHGKYTYESGKLKDGGDFNYEADIVVLDSSANSYKVQWTFHLPALVKLANPSIGDSLFVFEGMKMLFTTSETGRFTELLNWEEVRDTYIRMMYVSIPKDLDSAGMSAVEKSKEFFATKEMVESALIKEINLYYFPFGYAFPTKQVEGEDQLPNPFGGDPLPSVQTLQATELEPSKDNYKIIVKQIINKEAALQVFDAILKKMNIPGDSTITEAKKVLAGLEINDSSEYDISKSTGWVNKMTYKREVKNGQTLQIDSFVIEMKE